MVQYKPFFRLFRMEDEGFDWTCFIADDAEAVLGM